MGKYDIIRELWNWELLLCGSGTYDFGIGIRDLKCGD